MKMSDETYTILKFIAQIVLPALSTLYLALGSIWQGVITVPYPEQISATVMAVDTFLGILLGITSNTYYKNNGDAHE